MNTRTLTIYFVVLCSVLFLNSVPVAAIPLSNVNLSDSLGAYLNSFHELIFNPAPSSILTPPAFLTYSEDATLQTYASMDIVGGDFDIDSTTTSGFVADYWKGSFSISQDSGGIVDDVLSINGNFIHRVNPPEHNDISFGNTFDWHLMINDSVIDVPGNPSTVSVSQTMVVNHLPTHYDTYNAKLTATIRRGLFGIDDISGWTFNLTAAHVPEPATLALLGLGSMALLRRWR